SVDRPNGRTDDQRAKPTRPLSSPLRESGSRLLHAGSPPERKGVVYKRTGRGRSVPERRAPASAFPANHLEPELRHGTRAAKLVRRPYAECVRARLDLVAPR